MKKRYKGRNTSIQSHLELAVRLQSMANSFHRKYTQMADEDKKAQRDLEEQAREHRYKAQLFRKSDAFTMIL